MNAADANATIDKWSLITDKLATAIASKDYNSFNLSYYEGCRCFHLISQYLIENEPASELRDRILKVSALWTACANRLETWKNELGKELSSLKKTNIARGKLTNAYAFKASTSGTYLRRKAR